MLKHQNWIIIAYRRLEESFGIVGIRRRNDLQARNTCKKTLHILGMLRSAPRSPDWSAKDGWNLNSSSRHITKFSGIVGNLIHCKEKKVAILDIGDRTHPHNCGVNCR